MGFRYIGSKVRIAKSILDYIGPPSNPGDVFLDAFSGTGVVGSIAADMGWRVCVNDMLISATTIASSRLTCGLDAEFKNLGGYEESCRILSNSKEEGFMWQNYSPASRQYCGFERRYFSKSNAKLIDGARANIRTWERDGVISETEKRILLASVISAMNEVANIAGTYGCFISHWTKQSMMQFVVKPLSLRKKRITYSVMNEDAAGLVKSPHALVYVDPPYTKRQYASYYHIMETLVRDDNPVVDGVCGLRPWRDNSSVFCYKTKALQALVNLIISANAKRVVLSYSDEGHVRLGELTSQLVKYGDVKVVDIGKIGRYRPNSKAGANRSSVNEYLVDYLGHEVYDHG